MLARTLELVDLATQRRLSSPRFAGEQDRIARARRDLLELLDQLVEGRVARLDPAPEERSSSLLPRAKPRREPVVLREVEVDDIEATRIAHRLASRSADRRGVEQATRPRPGLAEQEQADQGDVGAGR